MTHPPDKTCVTCGRTIAWRRKWARSWDEVKYCGDRCRASKGEGTEFETTILDILARRAAGKTMCPSEALPLERRSDADAMEAVRRAARRLVARGLIEITQGGRVVDPSDARGPIRLRLTKKY